MAYEITGAQYKAEWIQPFERGETYLKACVTPEMVMEGNSSAVFAVRGTGSGMSSRGANGLIPTRNATDTQVTVTLKERHTLENHTKFNVFTTQGGKMRQNMQLRSRMDAVREIDDEIILALETASTQFSASAITMSHGAIADITSDLWTNDVGDEITFVWTPKAWAKLNTLDAFINADYVDGKPLMGKMERPKYWNGATHMMHNGLPGRGTSTAKCYAFAKSAIGHAMAAENIDIASGYNEEQAYSWDRASINHASVVLKQSGLLEIVYDDTAAIS